MVLSQGIHAKGYQKHYKQDSNNVSTEIDAVTTKYNKQNRGKKMNKNIKKGIAAVATSAMIAGCGGGSNGGNGQGNGNGNGNSGDSTSLPQSVQDALSDPKSELSQDLANTISYMGNEERLAYDVYNKLYQEWGTKQFSNIPKSEYKHITAVQKLAQKYTMNDDVDFTNTDLPALGYVNTPIEDMEAGSYDISKIQGLYDDLTSMGSASEIDALKVGCIVEVVDVTDLDGYIALAKSSNASDVETVFEYLRSGSYNHYWAFDKGLKNKGVSDGCCSLGTIDGTNYCHTEYPKK